MGSEMCIRDRLKVENTKTILTSQLQSNRRYKIPIAHGEGRFFANPETIASMEAHQQILFRYVDDNLEASEQANPNGSVKNIAGICNTNKNVFGMMPHPERAADLALNNQDGEGFFLSILHHFEHELA